MKFIINYFVDEINNCFGVWKKEKNKFISHSTTLIRRIKRLRKLLEKERQPILFWSIVSRHHTLLEKNSDGEDRLEKTE